MRRPVSLRTRLLVTLVSLVSVALVVADFSSVTALRSYLLDQKDTQLQSASGPVTGRFGPPRTPGDPANIARPGISISDFYVEYRQADGTIDTRISPTLRNDPAPELSVDLINPHVGRGPFNVHAVGEPSFKYRALASPGPGDSGTVVVAVPLSDIDNTVRRLILAEILVTTAVLCTLLLLGWYLVRADLRPLEEMTDTAGAIAAGDLSRRVSRADEQTEVGKLGRALNGMLTRIEDSFAEKEASEGRLRRFAADASHELRTPLTSIRGYAELYRQGAIADTEHLDRVMSRIEAEAARMGVMVDDLLLLARLDQGRPLEREDVDFKVLVTNVVNDARVRAENRTIETSLPEGKLIVDGDGGRLHQVLANLIGNALVHTPDGTPVKVEVKRNESTVEIDVVDEGPGLEPQALDKVFERFYRVDAGRSRNEGGTGLGLAIVKAIVEAHNGTVSARSSVGKGTTFTVTLPLTDS